MLRGEMEREVWTCKRPVKQSSNDIEETFEYPCWGTVDLTKE